MENCGCNAFNIRIVPAMQLFWTCQCLVYILRHASVIYPLQNIRIEMIHGHSCSAVNAVPLDSVVLL